MKRQSSFKQLISLMLMLALVVGLMPLGAFNSYADLTINHHILGPGVEANYILAENAIVISGAGNIDSFEWEKLAQLVNPNYFTGTVRGWDKNTPEDFKIIFRGTADNSILLCGSSPFGGMFEGFSNEIIFEKTVDLAPMVIETNSMFADATSFDQPVNFNTDNVQEMNFMFFNAASFDQPVDFNTANVEHMNSMFAGAASFNQAVNFNTAKVTDMRGMFSGATSFNQKVNFTDTSKVASMSHMFSNAASFNQAVNFDTAKVTDMSYMFLGAASFDQPVGFNTANVEYMSNMFSGAAAFNQEVNFNTAKVTDMSGMFAGAASFNKPVIFSDTSSVTDMSAMFADAEAFNQEVNFDTAKVTIMSAMFADAEAFNQEVNFNTANVTDMSGMFSGATAFNQPVYFNDTSSVTNMSGMFSGAASFNQPVNFNDTSSVTDMSAMFIGAASFNQPVNFNDTSSVTDMSAMFTNAVAFNQPVNFDTTKVTDMNRMFASAKAFNQEVNFDTANVTDMSYMFTNAVAFNQPVNFDTTKVTDMNHMFASAKAFNQAVNFDTAKVTDMGWMFADATSFKQPVDFEISSLNMMQEMFLDAPVSTVQLRNSASKTDIEAYGAFAHCRPQKLIFSGLKNAQIDGFIAAYEVEKNGTAAGSGGAATSYEFDDNASYVVALADVKRAQLFSDTTPLSVDLTELLSDKAAFKKGTLGTVGGDTAILADAPTISGSVLNIQFSGSGSVGDSVTLPLTLESNNYQPVALLLEVELAQGILTDETIYQTHIAGATDSVSIAVADYLPSGVTASAITKHSIDNAAGILATTSGSAIEVTGDVISYHLSGSGSAGDSATVVVDISANNYTDKRLTLQIDLIAPDDSGSGAGTGDSGSGDDSSDDGDWIVVDEGSGTSSDNSSTSDASSNNSSPDGSTSAASVPAEPLSKQFSDVKLDDWFYAAVYDVVAKGLIKGTTDNTFSPQRNTSRAMLATILYRLADQPAVTADRAFNDVAAGSWYDDAVKWAAANGIVSGYPDNSFKPNRDLTREQLVTMLYRYAKAQQRDVSGKADLSSYADNAAISAYAREAMQWAVGAGIINGVGGNSLAPQGSATRAQLAMMISRFVAE